MSTLIPTIKQRVRITHNGKTAYEIVDVEVLAVYFTTGKMRIRYNTESTFDIGKKEGAVCDVDSDVFIYNLLENFK